MTKLTHLSIPVNGGISGNTKLTHLSLPVKGGPTGNTKLTHISLALPPLIINQVVVPDNYSGDRPFTYVQISNAELIDKNPTVEMRFVDPFPLTFDPGSMTANESGFVFGIDPKAIWIKFDIEYFCVVGRNIIETGKEQLLKSV